MKTFNLQKRFFFVVLAVAGPLAGCDALNQKVPVRNKYCDGTDAWKCGDPKYPYCDLSQHLCVDVPPDMGMCNVAPCDGGTDLNADLADMGPICTMATVAADCTTAAQPICDTSVPGGACIACRNSGDDGQCNLHQTGKLCLTEGTNVGQCGDCRPANNTQSPNCSPSPSPTCDLAGKCRKCQAHSECTSDVCNIDGTCADQSAVVYANNASGTCSDAPHTSTPNAPYWQIQKAIDNIGTATIVRVFPSAAAYSLLTISSGNFAIVGTPATAPICATNGACVKVSGDATNPAISISGTSTLVILDGIEVTGIFAGLDGVSCLNGTVGPSVTILRSYLHGLSGAAVTATKCKLTIDRSQLGPGNSGGAIALSSAQYSISNNFIVGNASTTKPAITLDGSELSGGLGFRNNSVIKNGNLGGVGGIACNTGTMDIRDSIVWQNTTSNTGGAGTCNLINTVTTPSPDPTFVNSAGPNYDAHLSGRTAANLACCIDQVTSSPNDHDYDGDSRPLPAGGKWDIGGDEVP